MNDQTEINAVVEPVEKTGRRRLLGFWQKLSYTTRVTLAFALIAAMTAFVATGVVSFVWEQHFRAYTTENMQNLADETAKNIAANYARTANLASSSQGPADAVLSLYPGVGVMVVNDSNVTVYDSSWVRKVRQEGVPQASLAPRDPNQMARAAIKVNDKAVGTVRIWVYGSDALLRQPDQEFRTNSYEALFIAALVAIVLASCIGFLFARNLVAPINRMTTTARAIKEGDLSARTNLHGDDEIARLGETFDAMAESVEKERDHERQLTTDVAHELRTPLMAIQATVEAMVDGVFEPTEERLSTVNSEVERLSRLVDALLKLSRLENRANPNKVEVVDVGSVLDGIIATHEAFVTEAGLTLEYSSQKNVLVLGDSDMIRQATANLISNAVRYTPEGGKVTVTVTRDEAAQMAHIAVRDTGIGLSPDEVKMVFSRFWRADEGRNRASGGLGIGLAVVKEIVNRHNGWVQVEGEKGKGACFTIHLPLYVAERSETKGKGQSGSRAFGR